MDFNTKQKEQEEDEDQTDERRASLSSDEDNNGNQGEPLEYNDLFMQPIKMKAGNIFFKPIENNKSSKTTLKSSTNSDRYKQPEESGDLEEANDGNDSEEDEYGDEIIDLGDDVQPFSMQFKLEKPIIVAKQEQTIIDPYQSFKSLPKKRGGGFDLSEMILGRQSRPMEVEDRIEDEDAQVDINDLQFDMKVEQEDQQEANDNPYFLMDSLKEISDKKPQKNPLFEMSVSVSHKEAPLQQEQQYEEQEHEELEERDEIEDKSDTDEPYNYDSAIYQKFSSSYKFNNNEIQDFRNMAGTGVGNDDKYQSSWRRAAAYDDIEDDSIFEPIQDDNFEEEEYIKAPKLDMSELEGKQEDQRRNIVQFGSNLSLLKKGLNEIDLRKPLSVEKSIQNGDTSKRDVDVIQHNKSSSDEVPELIRDKNVKIIKQTKNEIIQKLSKKVKEEGDEKDDDSSSDGDFERSSNEDFKADGNLDLLQSNEFPSNYEQVDKDGVKWTVLNDNQSSSWNPLKKFDRWIIVDPIRAQLELQERENENVRVQMKGKMQISSRLEYVMEQILSNLAKRSQPCVTKKVSKVKKNDKPIYHFSRLEFGDNFQEYFQGETITIQPATSSSQDQQKSNPLQHESINQRPTSTLNEKFIFKKPLIRIRDTPLIKIFSRVNDQEYSAALETSFNSDVYDCVAQKTNEVHLEREPWVQEIYCQEPIWKNQERKLPNSDYLKEREEQQVEELQRQSVLSSTPQPLIEEPLLSNLEWYRQVTDNTPQQLINFDQLLLQDQDPFEDDYQQKPVLKHNDEHQLLRTSMKRASSLNSSHLSQNNPINPHQYDIASKKLRISRKSIQFVRGLNNNHSQVPQKSNNTTIRNGSQSPIKKEIQKEVSIEEFKMEESKQATLITVEAPNINKNEIPRILKIKKAIIIPKSTEAAEPRLHPVINQLKLRNNQAIIDNNSASKKLKIANKSSEMSLAQKLKIAPKRLTDQLVQDSANEDISPPVFKSVDAGNDIKVEDFDDYISEPALVDSKPQNKGTMNQLRLKIAKPNAAPQVIIQTFNLPKQNKNIFPISNSPPIGKKLQAQPTSQILAALQSMPSPNNAVKKGNVFPIAFKNEER